MTGGLLQMVAYGTQDIYLTGNPQITFFKVVYRRYTNFAIETMELPLVGNIKFGNELSCKISKSGDLINRMYIRVTICEIDPECHNFAWIRRLGHALLDKAEVQIGGTIIDRQYGTWLDIWYELARKGSHETGYAQMIGDIRKLTKYNSKIKPEYTMYIPLQFWFNRFVGLSFPLIALQYQEVFVNIQFETNEKLCIRDRNFDLNKVGLKDASLLVDYIFLDTDERKRFAQVGHEYLIEQLQWNGEELISSLISRYSLDFNHPTKEIIWASRNGNYTSGKTFIYYTDGHWCLEEASRKIVEKSISLGDNPCDFIGGDWVEVGIGEKSRVGTFFVKNCYVLPIWVNPQSLKINDYGITDKISADVLIDNEGHIHIDNLGTELTIRDLSIPLECMEDTRFNTSDPIVYQFSNYGLFIDGTCNPVQWAQLQLNGHDRFERREGAYFNYVQPEQHHSNTPVDGVNVYSFSLHPEEHQPSGTANLSRISKTDLNIWFSDGSCSNQPSINFMNPDSKMYVYGTNYNVLRVMSGLCGLAYRVN